MASIKQELGTLVPEDAPHSLESDYGLDQLQRQPWDWDRVVKGSHLNACAWQQHCSFNIFVKDGVVLREEQAARYPHLRDPIAPDINPRGCNKGVCYSHRMYDASRLKYPLKRAGARGEGRWQRISWDKALTEIADTLIDTLATDGPGAIVGWAANMRSNGTAQLVGKAALYSALDIRQFWGSDVGDHWPGISETFGKMFFADSPDNWFHASLLFIWGGNPAFTHIPNFHFVAEARYHGVKVIAVTPDYTASAIHADQWVPVRVGSDAALALGMAQVIVQEHLYNESFLREQTDLPLLVREDTHEYLRQRDLKRGGVEDLFYFYDVTSHRIVEAPRKSLALHGAMPALEGEYEVNTLQGKVKVIPVMEMLRRHLSRAFTPEQAATICGVSPDVIRSLAREVAQAKGVVNTCTSVWGKFYHGDLIERAIALVFTLCGHIGRKGSTLSAFPAIQLDAAVGDRLRRGDDIIRATATGDPRYLGWREAGYTDEMIMYNYVQEYYTRGLLVPAISYIRVHSGLQALHEKHNSWDPYLKRPLSEYVEQARQKGWQPDLESLQKGPQVWISCGGDFFRRERGTNQMMDNILPKLKLLVTIDYRMNFTGLHSDIVLPVAVPYEQTATFSTGRPATPFLHVNEQATPPFGEAKTEWQLFLLLAKKIEERAKVKGIATFQDVDGNARRLDQLVSKVTVGGLYAEDGEEDLARDIFSNAANIVPMDWEDFKKEGITPFTGIGKVVGQFASFGNACDLKEGEPIVPLTWHTEKKEPYPTLTRRIQFFLDQELFQELGEALPTHKDPPKAGGEYPLQMTGGHTRWSLHSDLIDDVLLMRLQRGEPTILMSVEDAQQRGIQDGDRVEVHNDVGSFSPRALVSPTVRPGQVVAYHGWVNYQFPGRRHFKSVQPGPMNPNTLAGGYFHIQAGSNFQPALPDRDTRVEVARA